MPFAVRLLPSGRGLFVRGYEISLLSVKRGTHGIHPFCGLLYSRRLFHLGFLHGCFSFHLVCVQSCFLNYLSNGVHIGSTHFWAFLIPLVLGACVFFIAVSPFCLLPGGHGLRPGIYFMPAAGIFFVSDTRQPASRNGPCRSGRQ